jgi:hypothetical protein
MISVENICTLGITILALIVLLHAISYVTVTTYLCNTEFINSGKCPDDDTFYNIRYTSLCYVVLIPILAIFGFLMKTPIPLIVAVLIWIIGVIHLQVSDPKMQYVVGFDNTNQSTSVSYSPLDPIKVFREANRIIRDVETIDIGKYLIQSF